MGRLLTTNELVISNIDTKKISMVSYLNSVLSVWLQFANGLNHPATKDLQEVAQNMANAISKATETLHKSGILDRSSACKKVEKNLRKHFDKFLKVYQGYKNQGNNMPKYDELQTHLWHLINILDGSDTTRNLEKQLLTVMNFIKDILRKGITEQVLVDKGKTAQSVDTFSKILSKLGEPKNWKSVK